MYWTQVSELEMRRILLLALWQFGLLAAGGFCADVVTLKDGSQISGLVESGNTQELHVKADDRSQTIDIHQVQAIQFGVSVAAPVAAQPQSKTAGPAHAAPEPDPDQPNGLILKDGAHVAGRWWSIDASNVHFLVNQQLQHYARADVLGVTFGSATLPKPPAQTPPPATPAQRPANPTQPAQAPQLGKPSTGAPPQPSTSTPTGPGTPSSTPSRTLSRPDEIGMVYSWNGKVLTPLERNPAVGRRSGSDEYWEIAGPRSRVRVNEAPFLVFVVYLPQGVDPASYSLFPLETVNGGRRTRPEPGRRGGVMTWPVEIEKKNDASVITYVLSVKDLPTGEYSFSPSSSNDGYCFGVDPSAPGQ